MTDLATLAIEVRTSGVNRATRDLHDVERASQQTEKAVDSLSVAVNALKRLMALGIGIQGLSGFLQMADTMQSLRAQVKFVTGSLAELNKVQAELTVLVHLPSWYYPRASLVASPLQRWFEWK